MDFNEILKAGERDYSQLDVNFVKLLVQRMTHELDKAVIGYPDVKRLVFCCLLTGRHVSFKSVPGLGKTQMALALGEMIVGAEAAYKQFQSDLMPADIIGYEIMNRVTGDMLTRPGPFLGGIEKTADGRLTSRVNIACADEINRANPKTQSGVLSMMQEGWVTIGLDRIYMPKFFFMIATRNPIENEGTYPLPEAQLDRIGAEAVLDYLSFEDEVRLAMTPDLRRKDGHKLAKPATDLDTVLKVQDFLHSKVFISKALTEYAVSLTRATRPGSEQHKRMLEKGAKELGTAVQWGTSPRAYLSAFLTLGQAIAASEGRNYVRPSDIQWLAPYVLTHRLILNPLAPITAGPRIVSELLDPKTGVPVNDKEELYRPDSQ